jgi:hypothetical protein
MDIARGEMVEKELDAMTQRRSRQKDPDEEKRRQMARLEWHLHHTAQAERLRRTPEALACHHEAQAARLIDVQPDTPGGELALPREYVNLERLMGPTRDWQGEGGK